MGICWLYLDTQKNRVFCGTKCCFLGFISKDKKDKIHLFSTILPYIIFSKILRKHFFLSCSYLFIRIILSKVFIILMIVLLWNIYCFFNQTISFSSSFFLYKYFYFPLLFHYYLFFDMIYFLQIYFQVHVTWLFSCIWLFFLS